MITRRRIKILLVFGTRPEAIKMAPVWSALQQWSDEFEVRLLATGQHREMLDQVLQWYGMVPDYDLNLMSPEQNLVELAVRLLPGVYRILTLEQPDLLLAQGDTSTSLLASLAAFYHRVPVGHVEAGLRTYQRYSPFPEETNRRLTAILTDWHFAPTSDARQNLIQEHIPASDIFVTGNTVIDALLEMVASTRDNIPSLLADISPRQRIILVTTHRRENLGPPMHSICRALLRLTRDFPDVEIILSMHPNPKVREILNTYLRDIDRIRLTEPLDYAAFIQLINRSFFVMTDSGGIQEEAPALGKPVLILRDTTERPEAVRAGTAVLVGTGEEDIYHAAANLMQDQTLYERMSKAVNPFGDGKAAQRIVEYIRWRMGYCPHQPEPFA